MVSNDESTTAMGLFNYALSFWLSGAGLARAKPRIVTHPDAPVTMLLCQAIELYLKSFLRLKGRSVQELEDLRHRY